MRSTTIETDGGTIELCGDYDSGNTKLRSQDKALSVTVDKIKIVDRHSGTTLQFFRGGSLAGSVTATEAEAEAVHGFIARNGDDTEFEWEC